MKKVLLPGVALGIALIVAACQPGGSSISLEEAKTAYFAVFAMSVEAQYGMTVIIIDTTEEYTAQNAAGSLVYDRVPGQVTGPYVITVTMTGYFDENTSSTMDGTAVTTGDGPLLYPITTVYDITRSSPMTRVTSVTGAVTSNNITNSGTLYLNGQPYPVEELYY
jgi:hypothetical protein